MTPQPEASTDPTTGLDQEITALASAVRQLHHRQQRGELAELRRMNPGQVLMSAAFQRLLAGLYPGRLDENRARRLAVLTRILALPMSEDVLKEGGRILGETLARVGISENRVQRLLLARDEAFDDQLLLLARRLVNAGALPFREMGRLILGSPGTVERTRYDIARGYWVAKTPALSTEPLSSGDQE